MLQYGEQVSNSLRKKVIGRSIIIFLSVMLLLTFFSNTINNFSLPKVVCETPTRGSLVKDITGTGTVKAAKALDVYIQSNMRVNELKVSVGDKVKKGQLLMSLDTSEVAGQLEDELDRYEQKKISLEKIIEASSADSLLNYDKSIDTAKINMDKAKDEYENIKQLYEESSETVDSLNAAKVNYDNSVRDYNSALKNKENAIKENGRNLKTTQLDLDIAERKIDELKKQVKLSTVTASADGVITELNFDEGTMANSSKPLYKIADIAKGLEFAASVDVDSAAYLAAGDEVEVSINSLDGPPLEGSLEQIKDNQQQRGVIKDLIIKIPSDSLVGGESGSVNIRKNIGSYQTLVPNSAVAQDNDGYFVYVLKERKGPLGNEYYAQKASITIDESDDLRTAVINGLGNFEKVISSTDKALSDGTRVLLSQ
jgi:HlyD family secretion protein